MKNKALLAAALLICFNSASSFADGNCAVTYNRTACKGQESMSFKKCKGNPSCTKEKPAASPAECQVMANQACANDRLDITKSKVVTATFDGQKVLSKSGKEDFCLDYENVATEFNKCPEDK